MAFPLRLAQRELRLYYKADVQRNQNTVKVILPPARGSILDRNGIALAENRASYDIDVYLRELVGQYRRSHDGRLPMTQIKINGRLRPRVDVPKIVNQTAYEIFKVINLPQKFSDKDIIRHFNQTPNVAFPLAKNLDFATLSQFMEHDFQIPGVEETVRPTRQYPFGSMASHIVGYLGALEQQTDADYQPDFVGKKGIERSFDDDLQGVPGAKLLRKNSLGFILGEEGREDPISGDTVYLTIDARIQWIAEQAMRKVGRGAAVVVDPNNGDILAMVSVPSFDPNDFVPSVKPETWRQFNVDGTKPLFNRMT